MQVLILSIAVAAYNLKGTKGVGYNLCEIDLDLLEILVVYYGKVDEVGDLISLLLFDFEVDLSLRVRGIIKL